MKKIIIPFLIYSTIMGGEPSPTKRGVVEDFTQLKYKVATATRTKIPKIYSTLCVLHIYIDLPPSFSVGGLGIRLS